MSNDQMTNDLPSAKYFAQVQIESNEFLTILHVLEPASSWFHGGLS